MEAARADSYKEGVTSSVGYRRDREGQGREPSRVISVALWALK